MTYAPATLSALARFWINQGGTMLGIVGNRSHVQGYHLGKDRIFDGSGPGLGWADYSVQLPRDKAGLSNAASAIDLGKLNGRIGELRKFSKWLVAECRADPKKYRDIREIIYSPDGVYVKRYSHPDQKVYTSLRRNPDGSITIITPGNGDASHFGHTHISPYRDSVARDLIPLFAGYFAPPIPDSSTEPPMPVLTSYIPGQVATLKATSNVRSEPKIGSATLIRTLPSKETWTVTGWVKGEVDPESGSDLWITRWANGRWEYTAKVNLSAGPAAPPAPADPTPYGQADIDAATAPLEARLATKNAALRIIAAEASDAASA